MIYKRIIPGAEGNCNFYVGCTGDEFPQTGVNDGDFGFLFNTNNQIVKMYRRESGQWVRYYFDHKE